MYFLSIRLFTTLFIFSGSSLSYTFRVGISTLHEIVREMNEAVWKLLQLLHVPVPMTEKWINIGKPFYETCQMPNCIGSIDRKHSQIKCPPKASSQFYNKSFHSVVLLEVAGANYNFILIDVGGYGRDNESKFFSESSMGKAFSAMK
jgi:hypothetical protein